MTTMLADRRVKIRPNRYPQGSNQSQYHGETGTIISMNKRFVRALVLLDGRADICERRSLPAITLPVHLDDLELV